MTVYLTYRLFGYIAYTTTPFSFVTPVFKNGKGELFIQVSKGLKQLPAWELLPARYKNKVMSIDHDPALTSPNAFVYGFKKEGSTHFATGKEMAWYLSHLNISKGAEGYELIKGFLEDWTLLEPVKEYSTLKSIWKYIDFDAGQNKLITAQAKLFGKSITSFATATDDYSSFKLIAACFQSNLPFRIKTDCVCRILALRYGLDVVGILLYDGLHDKLTNKGSYIDPAFFTVSESFARQQEAIFHLLSHISFYDFLYYKYYRSGIPAQVTDQQIVSLISEFIHVDKVAFHYQFDTKLLTPAFVRQCHEYSILLATSGNDNDSYYCEKEGSFYHNYKKAFPLLEQYEIGLDVNNYSGRVFEMVMTGIKQMPDIAHPFVFNDEIYEDEDTLFQMHEQHKKLQNGLYKLCGLTLSDNLLYFGIPLWSNSRCIGVIRILLTPDAINVYRNDAGRIKSLRHAGEILANFLDQSYAQEYVDEIEHDWGRGPRDAQYLAASRNKYCSSIRRALNASGSVLRLSEQPGSVPAIVGISTDAPCFAHIVEEMLVKQPYDGFISGQHFNPTLSQCFSSTHAREGLMVDDRYRLIGVQLDLMSHRYRVTYYYCYATEAGMPGNETVMETTGNFIFKPGQQPDFNEVFHPEAMAAMRNIEVVEADGSIHTRSIRYVLIMDIPALDVDGLFTVAATTNRPFSLTDVRFTYGEMKRFGLNMSSIRKEKLKDYQTLAGTYFHDLKNMTNIGMLLIRQLQEMAAVKALPYHRELGAIGDVLQLMKVKIIAIQRAASFELKPVIEEKQDRHWSIGKSINKQCRILETIAGPYKGTSIWVNKQVKSIPKTRLNQEVFDLCLFNLLENAVKFSYGKESKAQVPGYDANNERTPGHVHVHVLEEGGYILIRIANWGCKIRDTSLVFQQRERLPEVDNFLWQENYREVYEGLDYAYVIALWQLGANNGLYLVNKYITAIGGSCTCETAGDYSCFTLMVPKEKEAIIPPEVLRMPESERVVGDRLV